jgi:hypothetical protein
MLKNLAAAVLVVALVLVTAPSAQAMYSSTLGCFINRDPGVGLDNNGRPTVTLQTSGRSIQRDIKPYAGRGYQNGMSLYRGSFVPNKLDPSGKINEYSGYPLFPPPPKPDPVKPPSTVQPPGGWKINTGWNSPDTVNVYYDPNKLLIPGLFRYDQPLGDDYYHIYSECPKNICTKIDFIQISHSREVSWGRDYVEPFIDASDPKDNPFYNGGLHRRQSYGRQSASISFTGTGHFAECFHRHF